MYRNHLSRSCCIPFIVRCSDSVAGAILCAHTGGPPFLASMTGGTMLLGLDNGKWTEVMHIVSRPGSKTPILFTTLTSPSIAIIEATCLTWHCQNLGGAKSLSLCLDQSHQELVPNLRRSNWHMNKKSNQAIWHICYCSRTYFILPNIQGLNNLP